jgi:DNA-binding Xre family transcriptional regulator
MKRLPAFFYALPSGREPVREWLKSLPAEDRRIIGEDIKDVEFAWPIGRRSGIGHQAQEGGHMKKAKKKKTGGIGSSFDDFLKEHDIYEGATARAIKRVLARQLGELMRREEISKTELATRMKTSRAQLDRLLDPRNESVTLGTLARAAQAVGRHLRLELV